MDGEDSVIQHKEAGERVNMYKTSIILVVKMKITPPEEGGSCQDEEGQRRRDR